MSRERILNTVSAFFLCLSVIFFAVAVGNPHFPGDTDSAAVKVEKAVASRMAVLDALSTESEIRNLPADMVVYRYVGDSLKSWHNQFSVTNDDIGTKVVFQRLVKPIMNPGSPLAAVGDSVAFFNFGPKWYLVSRSEDGDTRTIKGLLVVNTLDNRSFNGVNPNLKLGSRYSIRPLSSSGGSEVRYGGIPVFKVLYDSLEGTVSSGAALSWLALVLFVLGAMLFLYVKPGVKRFGLVSGALLSAMAFIFLWGMTAQGEYPIFSPSLYADGPFLYSLGAVLIINLAVSLLCVSAYMIRESIPAWTAGIFVAVAAGILAYTHFILESIIRNSSISLELYKFWDLSVYTLLVYASILLMLLGLPLLLRIFRPGFGGPWRIGFSIVVSAYLVLITSVSGFRKEEGRLEVLSNRLAIDRDIPTEMQLLRVEKDIAGDSHIASLSFQDNSGMSIRNRLKETYFARLSRFYRISVETTPSEVPVGEPIAGGSRFVYAGQRSAYPAYIGTFHYSVNGAGTRTVVIKVEMESERTTRGYARILGIAPPGRVVVPGDYSFARYEGDKLVSFHGDYAYPTVMDGKLHFDVYKRSSPTLLSEGYTHFVNRVSESEAVIVSRPSVGVLNFLVEFVLLAITAFMLVSIVNVRTVRDEMFGKSYYRTRIRWVLMVSLWLTLVAMAFVSITFVYRRNVSNMRSIMTDRISAIQSIVSNGVRDAGSIEDLKNPEFNSLIEATSVNTNTDVTIYSVDGKVMLSTSPVVFETMQLGSRMDYAAFESVVKEGRRYFIQKERISGREFYSMYAPILNGNGDLLAILCSPYTDDSYDFEKDAVLHSAMILVVFLLLLMTARFVSSRIVDRMFKPLSEMGNKMDAGGLESLEYISYDRDDEITALVNAYNRMVTAMKDSSKELAQAERDKAWSGMARQVAHEIKNPLTPMKLQLQRIMRLKAKDSSGWQEKFDEVAGIILDHIDILTDTADEFSTFAKLYTEAPVEMDLDKVIREELAMFDGREGVTFEYFGLKGATASGPKPQLIRVFVNLVTNAVQAVEQVENPIIRVSLRNSVADGYYDMVFEDNGPGVAPGNREKLFTPNFTTKNGGSGLGLAISRSILERCGATISYSQSFALGGACFTIKYPKN